MLSRPVTTVHIGDADFLFQDLLTEPKNTGNCIDAIVVIVQKEPQQSIERINEHTFHMVDISV